MGNDPMSNPGNYENYGYRIITVIPDTPATKAGLEPQIDFIKYNPSATNKLFNQFIKEKIG